MKKPLIDPTVKFFIIIIGIVVLFGVLKELQFIVVPLIIAYLLVFVFENNKTPKVIIIFPFNICNNFGQFDRVTSIKKFHELRACEKCERICRCQEMATLRF